MLTNICTQKFIELLKQTFLQSMGKKRPDQYLLKTRQLNFQLNQTVPFLRFFAHQIL